MFTKPNDIKVISFLDNSTKPATQCSPAATLYLDAQQYVLCQVISYLWGQVNMR